MATNRMPLETWIKAWIYLSFVVGGVKSARPIFDISTDMGMVLVPADAEVDSVIFRLRATDQDADYPLVFSITTPVTPVVRIENLPCTLYNTVCQANVILTKSLTPGRFHDFAVRVRDSKGESNFMQATISVTNATTPRNTIFPHIPALIMVPEDTKPGTELDYVSVRPKSASRIPVYIELWQPKELFTIKQDEDPNNRPNIRGIITLAKELDFETQSMYNLTLYAMDAYTDPRKDTRNIAGLQLVVVVRDVQDVPPIFTVAPPLTKINNTVQPGDVVLRVHAEDGDKGVPREVTYGLVPEGNPFTPFFNISETTGEIVLARPLEELTQITHVGAPVVLSVVANEIRKSNNEPLAQATVVEVGLLLGEPGNSPPYFENDHYNAWIDENPEPGTSIIFTDPYITTVKDVDIGKAGVFALKLENNNGSFEISPAVAERTANFIITVRENTLIDYETYKSLQFRIIAQEVGPATNLSASVPVTIFLRDVNDNPPEFEQSSYEVTLSENVTAGTRVVQVQATDRDTGLLGKIQYTDVVGPGSEAFDLNPITGVITVAVGTSILDREITPQLQLTVEARDEDGRGLKGTVSLIVNLLDVNDNAPVFEKDMYEFTLNDDFTNFTIPAIIRAFDADAEPPNNVVRYELIHGNYDNKFYLDNTTGELILRSQIAKNRNTRTYNHQRFATKYRRTFKQVLENSNSSSRPLSPTPVPQHTVNLEDSNIINRTDKLFRRKREDKDTIFTLTIRAYDLGVPHLSGTTQVKIRQNPLAGARIVMFVVPEEHPDPVRTAQTLAAITGGRITVQEIRPYTPENLPNGAGTDVPTADRTKKSLVVARVDQTGNGASFVDIEKIRAALAANGVGVIDGDMTNQGRTDSDSASDTGTVNKTIIIPSEEVTVYRAENKLLIWLLVILALLVLAAIIVLIVCCICPSCPFYMAPRKRRVHSSETLITHSEFRSKPAAQRKTPRPTMQATWSEVKQAWSADPARGNWKFNRRNTQNYGLASLPGDVVRIVEREVPPKASSLHLRDTSDHRLTETTRRPEDERIYVEDMTNGARERSYNMRDESGSLRRHQFQQHLDQSHIQIDPREHDEASLRESHFYRNGNVEVMRLITRGAGETTATMHRPPEIVVDSSCVQRVDGKDILLQRFIEDQKMRAIGPEYYGSMQDLEKHSLGSYHRQKIPPQAQQQQQQVQQEILLIPENLEDHRQHIEELGPEVQRLIIDHGAYEKPERSDGEGPETISGTVIIHRPAPRVPEKPKEPPTRPTNLHYSIHDLELARQNALLTRLLLEKDRTVGGMMMDSGSYLETQSLPGQVAAGTQTNPNAATQTEQHSRSRSDNESEEDAKMRRKMKSKKRYSEEPRRIRTLWMRSPIREEQDHSEKQARKKIKDLESMKSSIQPEVLKEISDSLDETGDTSQTIHQRLTESSYSQYESRDKNVLREDSSSFERSKDECKKFEGRERPRERVDDKIRDRLRDHSNKGRKGALPEPSFRILEREMSSLSKKLSKLVGKKRSESEEDSPESKKLVNLKEEDRGRKKSHKEHKATKKTEIIRSNRSKSMQRTTQSSSRELVKLSDKSGSEKNQRIKHRMKFPISTASSEFEEVTVEKPKKMTTKPIAHVEKAKMEEKTGSRLKRQAAVEQKSPETTATARNVGGKKEIPLKRSKLDAKSKKSDTESDHHVKKGSSDSSQTITSGPVTQEYPKEFDRHTSELVDSELQQKSKVKPEKLKEKFIELNLKSSDIFQPSLMKSPTKSTRSSTDSGSLVSDKASSDASSKPSVETSPEFVKLSSKEAETPFKVESVDSSPEISKFSNILSMKSSPEDLELLKDTATSDNDSAETKYKTECISSPSKTAKFDELSSIKSTPEQSESSTKALKAILDVVVALKDTSPSSLSKSTVSTLPEKLLKIENTSESELGKIPGDPTASVMGYEKPDEKIDDTKMELIDSVIKIIDPDKSSLPSAPKDEPSSKKSEITIDVTISEFPLEKKTEIDEPPQIKPHDTLHDEEVLKIETEEYKDVELIPTTEIPQLTMIPTAVIIISTVADVESAPIMPEIPTPSVVITEMGKSLDSTPATPETIASPVASDSSEHISSNLSAAKDQFLPPEVSIEVDTKKTDVELKSSPPLTEDLQPDVSVEMNPLDDDTKADESVMKKEEMIVPSLSIEIPTLPTDIPLKKENLPSGQLSPISQTSSGRSPTRVIISRETSFLNSPKRQLTDEASPQTPREPVEVTTPKEFKADELLTIKIVESKVETLEPEVFIELPTAEENIPPPGELPVEMPQEEPVPSVSKISAALETYDAALDILDDDSDASSESSTQTAFIARPYGTPRHRRLVRMEQADTSEGLIQQTIELASPPATETGDKKDTELNLEETAEKLPYQPSADHLLELGINEDDKKSDSATSEHIKKIEEEEAISLAVMPEKSSLDVATQKEDTKAPKPDKIPEESNDKAKADEQFIINIVEKIISDVQEISDVKKEEEEAEEKVELISKHDTDRIAVVDGSASLADETESIEKVTEQELSRKNADIPEKLSTEEGRDADSVNEKNLLSESGLPLVAEGVYDEGQLTEAVSEVAEVEKIESTTPEPKEIIETPVKDLTIDTEDIDPSGILRKHETSESREKPTDESLTLGAVSVSPVLTTKKLEENMDGSEESRIKVPEQPKDNFSNSKSPPKLPKKKKVFPPKDSHEPTDKSARPRVLLKRQPRLDRPQTHIPETKPTSEQLGVQKRGRSHQAEKLKSKKGNKKFPPTTDGKLTLRPKDQKEIKTVDLPKKGVRKIIFKRSKLGVEEKSSSSEGDKTDLSTQATETEKSSPEPSSSDQNYTMDPLPSIPLVEKEDKKSIEGKKPKNVLELVETQSLNVSPLKPEDDGSENINSGENIEIKIDKVETERSVQAKDPVEDAKKDEPNLLLEPVPSTSGIHTPKQSPRNPSPSPKKLLKLVKDEPIEPQSRYMEWYKQNREETERRRQENEEPPPPKWLRKSTRRRWLKMTPDDRKHFDLTTPELTPKSRRKIKPLVNVESEQLKAIIRQGRKLRKAEGDRSNDPFVEIFAPEKPPRPVAQQKYYLVQHSTYKYEKKPAPFYLHPPPAPHPSPRLSPQHFQDPCPDEPQNEFEDSTMRVSRGLRHQQLLEKKSVFDIAYSEASPSHLRSDSTTPPS